MSRLRALVEDTLYGRRMDSIGCFATNTAAVDLFNSPPEVLSTIEEIIREVVVPRMQGYPLRDTFLESKLGVRIIQHEPAEFVGLLDLLGAYLAIGQHHSPAHVVEFLVSLPANVLRRALAAVEVAFGEADDDKVPPDAGVFQFLDNMTRVGDDEGRQTAARILSSLQEGSPAQTQ
jgi:hypothetical protein